MLEGKNIITSSVKVFTVLEELVRLEKATIKEIVEETGFSQSTTQRIINTLKHLRYIDQNENSSEYYPSFKLYELGNRVQNNYAIKNVAKQHMLDLYMKVDETVNLGILDGDSILYIDKIVSKSPLRVELDIGLRFPIYPSALGKAIAAFSDKKFSFKGEYVKYTSKTISSDEELESQLSIIRELGYAIDNEEYIDDLICISVPILNQMKKSVASISISVPKYRYESEKLDYYVSKLNECRKKVENDLC